MAVKRTAKAAKALKQATPQEQVWTYRGFALSPNDLAPAIGQIFNMAGQRANAFRQRLDTTTNWAIISTGATLSVAFSQPMVHHGIIIINLFLVLWFLSIEAQRYHRYELWNHLTRQIETDFYTASLIPPFHFSPEQLEKLIESLLIPRYPVSIWDAYGRRLRRRYFFIFSTIYAAWTAKTWLFPQPAASITDFVGRSAVGPLPGSLIIFLGLLLFSFLSFIAIISSPRMKTAGKVLPRFRKDKFNVLVITTRSESISRIILSVFRRNVTTMDDERIYVGLGRTILMCTSTAAEIEMLRNAVIEEDPQAYLIVSRSRGIFSRIFNPMEEE